MRGRHVFFESGVSVGNKASDVSRHALAFKKGFHGTGGKSHIQFFPNEPERDAVVMPLDLDVVIDINPGHSPLGIFIRHIGKRLSLGAIEQIKELTAGLPYLAQLPAVSTL